LCFVHRFVQRPEGECERGKNEADEFVGFVFDTGGAGLERESAFETKPDLESRGENFSWRPGNSADGALLRRNELSGGGLIEAP
jgi:hypothetical protein